MAADGRGYTIPEGVFAAWRSYELGPPPFALSLAGGHRYRD